MPLGSLCAYVPMVINVLIDVRQVCVCVCACVYMHMHVCECVCVCVCACAHVCVCCSQSYVVTEVINCITAAPIKIDTTMQAVSHIKWNAGGSILAMAGCQIRQASSPDKEVGVIQFYTPFGQVSPIYIHYLHCELP